jgi:small subunit ribosomal protein S3
MGQKVHPTGFRLAVTRDWDSRWYANKDKFPEYIKEDHTIRTFLTEKLRYASVPRIFIERASGRIRVKIFTARPGVVIGRKGAELDKIKATLNKKVGKEIMLDIQEVKRPDLSAQLVAENVALQLERRIAFRRAMKRAVQTTMAMGADSVVQILPALSNSAKAVCLSRHSAQILITASLKQAPCMVSSV